MTNYNKSIAEFRLMSFDDLARETSQLLKRIVPGQNAAEKLEQLADFPALILMLDEKADKHLALDYQNHLRALEVSRTGKLDEIRVQIERENTSLPDSITLSDETESLFLEALEFSIKDAKASLAAVTDLVFDNLCAGRPVIGAIAKEKCRLPQKGILLRQTANLHNPACAAMLEQTGLISLIERYGDLDSMGSSITEKLRIRDKIDSIRKQKFWLNIKNSPSREDQLAVLVDQYSSLSVSTLVDSFNNTISAARNLIDQLLKNISRQIESQHTGTLIEFVGQTPESEQEWGTRVQNSRRRAAREIRRAYLRLFRGEGNLEYLDFEIFPKGLMPNNELTEYFRRRGLSIDVSGRRRLDRIEEEFDYYVKCVGKNGFEGYVAYRFRETDLVIAEKPFYGNATYILKAEWPTVLKILGRTREDARHEFRDYVRRVIHINDLQWLKEVKDTLRYWK